MSKEAMKLALDALEMWCPMTATYLNTRDEAITALREALAEQKSGIKQVIELYDSPDQPSQRTWVGLTAEERNTICENAGTWREAMKVIEAKLKEKNCG